VFVGHAASFAVKRFEKRASLAVLFLGVQSAVTFYLLFAAVAFWLDRRRV